MVKYSLVSSAVGACPIPGVGVAVDVSLLTLFAKNCRDVYQISEDSLKAKLTPERYAVFALQIARCIGTSVAVIAAVGVDDALKFAPVIGTVVGIAIGVVISGPLLYFAMYQMRNTFRQILQDVLREIANTAAATVLQQRL